MTPSPTLCKHRNGPRRLRLLPALLLALVGPSALADQSSAWVDEFERAMIARSGWVLTLGSDAEAQTPLLAVFHAPLAAVWILADDTTVARSGTLHRGETGFVTITWDSGDITTLTAPPPIPETGDIHPLATFHDRLLSHPLATPVAGLPEGSRFTAKGIVERPDLTPQEAATLWVSLGDHIVITGSDGDQTTLHWTHLDAALQEAPE